MHLGSGIGQLTGSIGIQVKTGTLKFNLTMVIDGV